MTKQERRQAIREMCDILRSDLYKRAASDDPNKAVWQSPGHLRVEYTYDQQAEHQPITCRILNGDGTVYAETDNADAAWLEETLP